MKCCDITPAMLRVPVQLQRQVRTDAGAGATAITYETVANFRARVVAVSGNERLYAERLDAETRYRLTMRYRADLTESDRFIIEGKAYQIRFIDDVEFRKRWQIVDLNGGVPT